MPSVLLLESREITPSGVPSFLLFESGEIRPSGVLAVVMVRCRNRSHQVVC